MIQYSYEGGDLVPAIPNDMSHKTLAEAFKNGATKGKAGNTFIEGDKLYSYGYHFIIAQRDGNGGFYVTDRKYSQSTSHQTSIVRNVLSQGSMVTIKPL